MPLKCSSCRQDAIATAVCHHCGRPLCDDYEKTHRVEFGDSAFSAPPGLTVVAVHCRDCWEKNHETARGPRGCWPLWAERGSRPKEGEPPGRVVR